MVLARYRSQAYYLRISITLPPNANVRPDSEERDSESKYAVHGGHQSSRIMSMSCMTHAAPSASSHSERNQSRASFTVHATDHAAVGVHPDSPARGKKRNVGNEHSSASSNALRNQFPEDTANLCDTRK